MALVLGFGLTAGYALADGGCGSQSAKSKAGQCNADKVVLAGGQKDIVDTAVSAGSFNTLVAAVQAAGLVDVLKGNGPFTVFAPTDEAFSNLPEGTLQMLLKPENKDKLVAILTYHVLPSKEVAKDVVSSTGAVTVNGQRVGFALDGKQAKVGMANIVKTDIACSNGVIHVIDRVILPTDKNIVETAASAKVFGTLLTAATKAGLADTLANGGPFTLFAPTDEAFAKLGDSAIADLLKPENKAKLVAILKAHVISGRVYSDAAAKAGKAETIGGNTLSLKASKGGLSVNGANVAKADIDASNGVIHVIDAVILP
jgi:uncharacterized surface protein with fasciclin (FAS1) repeats